MDPVTLCDPPARAGAIEPAVRDSLLMRIILLFWLVAFVAACTTEAPEPSPEQLEVFSQPVDVELVVVAARNAMRFETTRIEAPEGATVRLVMDNETTTSPSMLHNVVVLAEGADVEQIGRAAAGVEGNVPDDPAVIVATPLARPRGKTAVVFTMPPAGEYPYICTYPGHFLMMQGVLVSTP
ncbi:MAG: hypothetical protein Rubg2KO_19320 [Rubricoccaceae bacterium]